MPTGRVHVQSLSTPAPREARYTGQAIHDATGVRQPALWRKTLLDWRIIRVDFAQRKSPARASSARAVSNRTKETAPTALVELRLEYLAIDAATVENKLLAEKAFPEPADNENKTWQITELEHAETNLESRRTEKAHC